MGKLCLNLMGLPWLRPNALVFGLLAASLRRLWRQSWQIADKYLRIFVNFTCLWAGLLLDSVPGSLLPPAFPP
jgi:hypothetical protein